MNYHFVKRLGGKGSAPDQFLHRLSGIALASDGSLYAVGDSVVRVFSSQGDILKSWATGRPGFSLGLEQQSVYVGETGQIEIFDSSGNLERNWRDEARLGRVTAIGFQGDSVLVADASARCIRRFDRQGKFLNNIGDKNRMKGFNLPNGALDFAVDRQGTIHACNPGKHRVERYTPDGELLGHIGRFDGRDPEGFPGCCNPTNVAVNEQGLLYVTEKAGPRAKVLDSSGKLISVIATDVFDPSCKNMDVAVNSTGLVYVIDTVKLCINVFRPQSEGREDSQA
jgi:sugar lactone lactonase YvrE